MPDRGWPYQPGSSGRCYCSTKNGHQYNASLKGEGHPEYLSTAKIVAEAGLALSLDEINCDQQPGVVTPSVGLGEGFVKRLGNAGITVDVESDLDICSG